MGLVEKKKKKNWIRIVSIRIRNDSFEKWLAIIGRLNVIIYVYRSMFISHIENK